MNRYRMRFAPQVWKPSLSPTLVNWLRPFRKRQQQRVVNIAEVEVIGQEIVHHQLELGHGVMIMPNHSSHADPYVIYAAADSVGTALHVMATWHVFHDKTWLAQWTLRKHGCFSVDREANDIRAFRIATDILQKKREPLVIFPEGEIYHCNDRVTPFREGAAAIAVTSARKADRPIVCVPCAITYRYIEDPSEILLETMGELEEAIFWRRQTDRTLEQRICDFAEVLLAIKELEYFRETKSGAMPDRIRALADHLMSKVEARHELGSVGKPIPERVKAARRTIIEKLSAEFMGCMQCQPGNGPGWNFRRLQFPEFFELTVIVNLFGGHAVVTLASQDRLHVGIHHTGSHAQSGHVFFFGSQHPREMV